MSGDRREISDPKAMRAFAHPTRLALLELIGREGELTASRAAALLDESPGNMSWHLQTLAKYGFVEEAGDGKGRSRPWRVASIGNRFVANPGDEGAAIAGDELASQVLERAMQHQREWFSLRHSYPQDWQDAAFQSESLEYLTAEELAGIREEILEIVSRHSERFDKRKRPEGSLPVRLTAFAHPLPPTEAGN